MSAIPDQSPAQRFDVAVIGGGPAGAALATFLQRSGHRCVVLEGSTFPRYHVGESLIPCANGPLERLGLLPQLEASAFPVKHSVRFVSPSGKETEPFYFSETLPAEQATTWQVDRSQFDRLCLDNAQRSGVDVRMATPVSEVLFENDRAVGVRATQRKGETYEIAAKVVVDASGRATILGSQLNLREPIPELDKASIWSYYRGGLRGEGIDAGETTLFMLPGQGWFWYIPLPDDLVSVGIVASPDDLFAHSQDRQRILTDRIAACPALADRLEAAELVGPTQGTRQLAYLNRMTCGDGWVMVGDARAFLDPIYSSGLFLALHTAEKAARCIDLALSESEVSAERLGAFEPEVSAGVDVIRRLILAFYNPTFSISRFLERYPRQRTALIDCLIGNVWKDMSSFVTALDSMTAPISQPAS